MAGSRLRKDERREDAGRPLSDSRRRRLFSGFFHGSARLIAAAVTATVISASGSNLKNLGPEYAMAGPAQARRPEREESVALSKNAGDAAQAFKDYLTGGDPAKLATFRRIYNSEFAGQKITEQPAFMDRLFRELRDAVTKDPIIKPLFQAFRTDRGRPPIFPPNPAHYTDFIEAVASVRAALDRGAAKENDITALMGLAVKAEGQRPGGQAVQTMELACRKAGLDKAEFLRIYKDTRHERHAEIAGVLRDAAIDVLEKPSHDNAAASHGARLVAELVKRAPGIQARICIGALRDFILTGDGKRHDEFKRIFDNNPFSTAFQNALRAEFASRILADQASGLKTVMDAYKKQTGAASIDPVAFAEMVAGLYKEAIGGRPEKVEELRARHGPEVVDNLLAIVSKGLAGQAMAQFRDIMLTGNAASERAFLTLLNGRIATIEGGAVVMKKAEDNQVFWTSFGERYKKEMEQNRGLMALHRTFNSNLLPIAIRDITAELAKDSPEMARLRNDYGSRLISLVSGNLGRLPWLARTARQLRSQIEARAGAGDRTAEAINRLRMENKESALAETYLALLSMKSRMRELGATGMLPSLEKSFDLLGWMTGMSGADIERELTRRAGERDDASRQMLGVLRTDMAKNNRTLQESCAALHQAYRELSALKAQRAGLIQKHGESFLSLIEKDLQHLHWVLKPAEETGIAMQDRRTSPFVVSVQTSIGYSVDSLAHAVRDIYSNIRTERERLVREYGAGLVDSVQNNMGRLGWAAGEQSAVRQKLLLSDDRAAMELRGAHLYNYTLAQFAPAIANARRAAARKGLPEMDAHDRYGRAFMEPGVWHEAERLASVGESLAERRSLVANCDALGRQLVGLRSHIRGYRVLQPAVQAMERHITRWARANELIRTRANSVSADALAALAKEWRELKASVIEARDIKNGVEMVFSVIHLAHTGGDLRTGNVSNAWDASADRATITALMGWYNSAEVRDSGKQPIIRDIVSEVLRKASPELHGVISRMGAVEYGSALGSAYGAVKSGDAARRRAATARFGTGFVDAVASQAGHLRLVESASFDAGQLSLGKNQLYADILLRCYNALKSPRPGENEAAMTALFGEGFVRLVKDNLSGLETLGKAGAGLSEINALPAELGDAIYKAYADAHRNSVGRLQGLFSNEDARLAESLSEIQRTLADKPPADAPTGVKREHDERMRRLRSDYGGMVSLVERMGADLRGMEGARDASAELSRLRPELLAALHQAYGRSEAAKRPAFMESVVSLSTRLPQVYLALRNALIYQNTPDEVGSKFSEAVRQYREVFGKDDHLFKQYVNLDLLNQSFGLLRQRYGTALPSGMTAIRTPEDLVRFLESQQGKELLRKGKEQFSNMERDYNAWRSESNISIDTGDLSDGNIANIRNQISVLDALYLGIALDKVQTSSSGGSKVMRLAMESMVIINNRDPYLVGPFLLQVLPAILEAARDEAAIELALTSFNGAFTARYSEGTQSLAYSDTLTRKYFLEVFSRIAARLPAMASVYGHTQLADEMRRVPEPTAVGGLGGTENPYLYRIRPGWWHPSRFGEGASSPVGAYAKPLHLTPNIALFPTGSLGAMQLTVDAGASELHERINLHLIPPGERAFRPRMPAGTRINAIGASTLIRRLNQLFGPMPRDYESYWLSWDATASGYYGAEGGEAEKQAGTVTGRFTGRTPTGGVTGDVRYTGTRAESTTATEPTAVEGGLQTTTGRTTDDTHAATARVIASKLPILGMWGIRTLSADVSTQQGRRTDRTTVTTTGPEETASETAASEARTNTTRGTLQSLINLAKKNQVAMIVYLTGEQVSGPGAGSSAQEEDQKRLKSRLYFLDQYGNAYQMAYGKETERQMNNFLFGGVDHNNVLASFQFLGQQMFKDREANAAGFNGAAVGFTIPTGGGDAFSALAFGQLVRNISTMTPVAAEQAVGMAVTRLLRSGRHRDIYAGFYRGTEQVTVDENNKVTIVVSRPLTGAQVAPSETAVEPEAARAGLRSRFATATGEFMWRRVSLSPGGYQFEVRAVGGYPATAGVQAKAEWGPERRRRGVGLTAAYSTVDMLQDFRELDTAATNLFATSKNTLVGAHGWSEDKAKDTGWLIALNYMYSRLEDKMVRNEDGTYVQGEEAGKRQKFASALFMYWARRHGILVGGQKVPRWGDTYTLIDQAMRQIQQNPENQASILQGLASNLERLLDNERWEFSLGYGYDGQKVGVYVLGAARMADDQRAYANLKGIFVFGRPAKAWMEVGGYGYLYPRVAVVEDSEAGGFRILSRQTEYLDVTAGVGSTRWPSRSHLYQREITVSGRPDALAALRNIHLAAGIGADSERSRLQRLYGRGFVGLVERNIGSLDWMVRPAEEMQRELQRRKGRDGVARSILLFMPGRDQTKDVTRDEAGMLREIYLGLRTPAGRERLLRRYDRGLVDQVAAHGASLDWLLLPPERMRAEFTRRAAAAGSPAARIAETGLRTRAVSDSLTGSEIQRMFEQNMTDVIYGCDSVAESKAGVQPHLYSVGLARRLRASRERSNTFYVLHSAATLRPGTTASLIIGNREDAREWVQSGKLMGSDITRVTVERQGDDYKLGFSGDRRLRYLSAWKLIGGVTVPLRPSERKYHDAEGNFTVGGLLRVLENHRFELLAGAMYGRRQYSQDRWENWTVTFSGRLRTQQTGRVDESWYGYVFVNRLTKKVVFASKDVFENAAEMREACRSISDGTCDNLNELSRTTGGLGITWSRMNVVTGTRRKLDVFFEAGTQRWAPFNQEPHGRGRSEPVFRAGAGYGLTVSNPNAVRPLQLYLGALGYRGLWNIGIGAEQPGIQAPNYLPMYVQSLQRIRGRPPWGVMFSLTFRY